jgi:hypothetical protein
MLSLTIKEEMMAPTVDRKMVRSWSEELEAVGDRLSVHFARSEVRQRAQDYLRGLLSEAERKNSLGSWPKWPGTQRPMVSSTSWDEPAGMPMP